MVVERQHPNETQTIISFYAGAYGPMIRIDVQTEFDLERTIRTFEGLTLPAAEPVEFARAMSAYTDGLHELILRVVAPGDRMTHVRKILENHQGERIFQWSEPVETWTDCVDLVRILHREPGHQYLTPENVGDALIEFAYCEERPPDLGSDQVHNL